MIRGESIGSPAATRSTAATISVGGESLSRKPPAHRPQRADHVLVAVEGGQHDHLGRVRPAPEPLGGDVPPTLGIRRSISTTSGKSASTAAGTSSPSAASPDDLDSGASAEHQRRPPGPGGRRRPEAPASRGAWPAQGASPASQNFPSGHAAVETPAGSRPAPRQADQAGAPRRCGGTVHWGACLTSIAQRDREPVGPALAVHGDLDRAARRVLAGIGELPGQSGRGYGMCQAEARARARHRPSLQSTGGGRAASATRAGRSAATGCGGAVPGSSSSRSTRTTARSSCKA